MSADRDAEILRYLSAISRDIGEFRTEFREFRKETNERLDKLEQRATEIEYELKIIGRDILKMRGQIEAHDDRLRKLEGRTA